MSDYHITTVAEDDKTINAVFHIPVPGTGTNQAGKTWREAVAIELGGAANITSILPDVQGTQEETDMKAGAILEYPVTVRFQGTGLPLAQKKLEVEAEYNRLKSSVIATKQQTLAFIGFSANVV